MAGRGTVSFHFPARAVRACEVARQLPEGTAGRDQPGLHAAKWHIRRLLAKYKYPPDKQESAVQLVMQQAELFAADLMAN
jgi:hypothetical protein